MATDSTPSGDETADVAEPHEEATGTAGDAAGDDADAAVMGLLSDHVPLSLLMDLSAPAGPDSEAILEQEGEPDEAWWEQR